MTPPVLRSASILVPAVSAYATAFLSLDSRLSERHRRLLTWHYAEPSHITTASDMADAMGYVSFHPANLHYGKLGQLVAEALGYDDIHIGISTLVRMVRPRYVANGEWLWIMRPQVAMALEQLEWVEQEPEYLRHALHEEGRGDS